MDEQGEVTQLLLAHQQGSTEAFDQLIGILYDDLRLLARAQLRRAGRALDTTSLVHEAYLKLVDQNRVSWKTRGQFFAIAARAMRQIIVDYVRYQLAQKRGGGKAERRLDEATVAVAAEAERLLCLNHAIERLGELDERLVRVVECRLIAGLTDQQTAEATDMSPRTVQRCWVRARAWLKRELGAA